MTIHRREGGGAWGLTEAERDVASLLSGGLSYEEVAGRRGRSPRTIANQVASVFRKVGVGSRAALVARLATGDLATSRRDVEARLSTLTDREREVAAAIARGVSNKQVAYELDVACATIAVLLRRALRKLGLPSRLHLIAAIALPANDAGASPADR